MHSCLCDACCSFAAYTCACRFGSPRYFSTFAAEGVHHTTRTLASASNKRNVSLSVILDAQLKRLHFWQARAARAATRFPTAGPFAGLSTSDFRWLNPLCPLHRLEEAWSHLHVGPLMRAKRASWIKYPAARPGLNDRVLRLNGLLWNAGHTEAWLVVAILQTPDDAKRTIVACVPCFRLQVGRVVQLLPNAVFLSVSKRVVLRRLEECYTLTVGAVSSVFWSQDILLSIETGLEFGAQEEFSEE